MTQTDRGPPLLHRLIAAGNLRYLIIASWGVALATVAPLPEAATWCVAATALGLLRSFVERRLRLRDPARHGALKLAVATISCVVWAFAPLLALLNGGFWGVVLAVGLLMAGYTLVFTQMRAALPEALVVSAPYSAVVGVLVVSLWGGQGFWVMVAMIPVVGLSLLIKVVITEMKDEQLAAVNERQRVLIQELEAARDRAHAASDAKSNFLGVISHELRTPMNGVLGAAQLLEMSSLNDHQRMLARLIRTSGDGLMVLLNDILDMTKIEAGKMTLAPQEIEADRLVEQLIGPFRAQAELRGLGFVVRADGLPNRLRIDALRLAQIVHNLLGNAIKFTGEGSITLTIQTEPGGPDACRLRISVADTGIGIAPEHLERLFQPFSQVDDSATRRFGGTGLGLSICERLARLMGGTVEVRSTPGQGSVFTVTAAAEPAPGPLRQAA